VTVRQDSYGRGGRQSWKYEDLGKATHAVLTIREVDADAQIPDDEVEEGVRTVLTLTFDEDEGEKTLYTNYRQVGYLIERLTENEKKWLGQRIVVKRLVQKFGKKLFKKVAIAPPEEWDKLLGLAAKRGRKAARATR